MSTARLLGVLLGVGLVGLCAPAGASVAPEPVAVEDDESRPALALLEAAVEASRVLAWSATQHVTTYVDGAPTIATAHLDHVPGRGSAVHHVPTTDVPVAADVFDPKLLALLEANYELSVVRVEPSHGRSAHLVEVLRPGWEGSEAVAARFWVDTATGMVLRRDVLDAEGHVLRRSELLDLTLRRAPSTAVASTESLRPSGRHLDDVGLADLRARGWQVPTWLPGGLTLYDARVLDSSGAEVVQLAYSDGLSTLSLFQQPGVVRATSGGLVRKVGGGTVWQSFDSPTRVVWSTGGRTWTVVSDATPEVVDEAVRLMPHDAPSSAQDGVGPRVWRGMCRVGSWLNPFS